MPHSATHDVHLVICAPQQLLPLRAHTSEAFALCARGIALSRVAAQQGGSSRASAGKMPLRLPSRPAPPPTVRCVPCATQVKWNRHNGNWLLTCSRDQLLKLYDVRMLKEVRRRTSPLVVGASKHTYPPVPTVGVWRHGLRALSVAWPLARCALPTLPHPTRPFQQRLCILPPQPPSPSLQVASFAGHGKDVTCCAWHPQHEELFVSGAGEEGHGAGRWVGLCGCVLARAVATP